MNSPGFILILVTLLLYDLASASTDLSSESIAFRNIQIDIQMEYLEKGRKLPSNIQELPLIAHMRANLEAYDVATLRAFNDIAIVPGAPQIELNQNGEKKTAQLLLVSREARGNSRSIAGRNIVFLLNNQVLNTWIEESEYNAITRSISDFDAMMQPVAFPDLDSIRKERQYERKSVIRAEKDRINAQQNEGAKSQMHEDRSLPMKLIVMVISIGVVVTAWIILSMRRRGV